MPAPEILVLAALVTAASYCVFGLTGFGSTVLALPLLAHFLPLKFAVPLMLLLDLTASLALSSRVRGSLRKDEFARFVPFLLLGMGLGVTLLVRLPERPLLATLGAFLLAYALYCLAGRKTLALSRGWALPAGVVSGSFSALFGTGGVLMVLYFAGRLGSTSELRATTAAGILVSSLRRGCSARRSCCCRRCSSASPSASGCTTGSTRRSCSGSSTRCCSRTACRCLPATPPERRSGGGARRASPRSTSSSASPPPPAFARIVDAAALRKT